MRHLGKVAGLLLSTLSACGSLASCMAAHSDTMLFGTNTKFALDASFESTTQTPTLTVGYKRQEFVWMPLVVNGKDSKCVGGDCPNASDSDPEKRAASELTAAEREAAETVVAAKKAAERSAAASAGPDKVALEKASKEAALEAKKAQDRVLAAKEAVTKASGAKAGVPGSKVCETCKYLGTDGNDQDTYSVLASFGTNFNGGQNPGGSIAQYFATGHAARILAAQGGSGLVNTNGADQQAMKALLVKHEGDVEKIVNHVKKPDGNVDGPKLKVLADAAGLPANWSDNYKDKPIGDLREALTKGRYASNAGKMASAIQ